MKDLNQAYFFGVFKRNSSPKKLKLKKFLEKTQGNLLKSRNVGAKTPNFSRNTIDLHEKLNKSQKKTQGFC